jgi:hypothetical protein
MRKLAHGLTGPWHVQSAIGTSASDAMSGAEVDHLLGVGDAADQRPCNASTVKRDWLVVHWRHDFQRTDRNCADAASCSSRSR